MQTQQKLFTNRMLLTLLWPLVVEQALNVAVYAGLLDYLRRWPQALIAPLMLQQPGPDGQLRRIRLGGLLLPLPEAERAGDFAEGAAHYGFRLREG